MNKIVAAVAVAVAVIAASVAGVVVICKRAEIARAAAQRASDEESRAALEAKTAADNARVAEANKREAEARVESGKVALAATEAANEKLRLENEGTAEKKALAEAERAKAEAEAQQAADQRAAKEAELKIARENADAERAKAKAAADELARAEVTKAIREAETLKLRISINELEAEKSRYDEMFADLMAFQEELDERERLLRPEKTIADLSWLPDEDTEVDENGRAHPRKKPPYLAENDASLPAETRKLAKAERVRYESAKLLSDSARERTVSRIEPLYTAALKEGRMVDAAYYRDSLKSLYPDWEYKGESSEK